MKVITFGNYAKNTEAEPIEWIVLKEENGKALITTKYAIEALPFNDKYEVCTWEKCSLRAWLNSEFIDKAFSADEKARICETEVKAELNPEHPDNDPGNDTTDKVFLFSVDEAQNLFDSDENRACKPTDYILNKGAYVNGANGNPWWWLRSPGCMTTYAAHVSTFGNNFPAGANVNVIHGGVRPAIWICL